MVTLAEDEQQASNEPLASISCRICRKRKVKCDRLLPSCTICVKTAQECSYPIGPLKPGPKLGSSRRRGRTQSKAHCPCGQSSCRGGCPPRFHQHDRRRSLEDLQRDLDAPLSTNGSAHGTRSHAPDAQTPQQSPTETTHSSPVRISSLFWILHPSHEVGLDPTLPPLQESCRRSSTLGEERPPSSTEDDVMQALGTTSEDIKHLLDLYFSNMTAFSLFHVPTFNDKIASMDARHDLYALLAAMFSFSARFRPQRPPMERSQSTNARLPSAQDFLERAYQYTASALNAYDDEPPSLVLLQAMVLTTFAELIKGARARAWRSLGTCVRIAYQNQLHVIDSDSESDPAREDSWVIEERRRAWWTIWEFDVFASTVCRLPTAIDWSVNETFLPIPDDIWFAKGSQASCVLERDPAMRWKSLQSSGNQSAKAWFIVVNSLMRNAHLLSNAKGIFPGRKRPPNQDQQAIRRSPTYSPDDVAILSNSLYCFLIALPQNLQYRNDHLKFKDGGAGGSSRQLDSDIYSIHIMIQLTRFKIFHEELFGSDTTGGFQSLQRNDLHNRPLTSMPTDGERSWKRHLNAAEEVVAIICNSSPEHFQHINPFLSNTIWLAASILLVYLYLTPPSLQLNQRLIESRFDILQAVFVKLAGWWGMSPVLGDKLSELRDGLRSLREQPQTGSQTPHGWTNAQSVIGDESLNLGRESSNVEGLNSSQAANTSLSSSETGHALISAPLLAQRPTQLSYPRNDINTNEMTSMSLDQHRTTNATAMTAVAGGAAYMPSFRDDMTMQSLFEGCDLAYDTELLSFINDICTTGNPG